MRNWGIKGSHLQSKAKLIVLAAAAQAKRSLARRRIIETLAKVLRQFPGSNMKPSQG
jgi:hypothetical protein